MCWKPDLRSALLQFLAYPVGPIVVLFLLVRLRKALNDIWLLAGAGLLVLITARIIRILRQAP